MAPKSTKSNGGKVASTGSTKSSIQATIQQSRFHTETLDTSGEIDLKDVTISIGERELISSSHLRLKEGFRYGFVGRRVGSRVCVRTRTNVHHRNGTGKSTLLTTIADKLIPGLGPSLRILLLSQVEDSARATEDGAKGEGPLSVLEHVVRGDKERLAAVEELQGAFRSIALCVLTGLILSSSLLSSHSRSRIEFGPGDPAYCIYAPS
jgi:ATP-binding cassette subfamily F protein 3